MPIKPKVKAPPLVTQGYSMPSEMRERIAREAERLNYSASALVVAVMEEYFSKTKGAAK